MEEGNCFGCYYSYRSTTPGKEWSWMVPAIALLVVAVMPAIKAETAAPTPETHVRCPDCKELVRKDARVCEHCQCKLPPVA